MVVELLRRFPRLEAQISSVPVLPAAVGTDHPLLADDARVVAEVLAGPFAERDVEALALQNAHRRRSVTVLLGSAFLTGFGGLQAAYPDRAWPGVVLGVLAAGVAAVSHSGAERGTGGRYLAVRLQAERLRALHFQFLARTPPFDGTDVAERRAALEHAVIDVERGKQPG